MQRVTYREFSATTGFWLPMLALAGLLAAGLAAAWYMEHSGHIVTGMSNRIVWGLPHVFAILLIVTASGALNVASVGSVFSRAVYKPMARLSGLAAIALLAGGLAILVLDLGRPDRLIVAMTSYNFRSIFAWNVFLYTGFLAITAAYLLVMMARGLEGYTKPVGLVAFVWRLALTTGTGSIFGWLVARDAYDSAVMAPLFIALSLALGTAAFILLATWLSAADDRVVDDRIVQRLGRLMGLFVAANLYFAAVQHLSALYIARRTGVEAFLLWSGGIYPVLLWVGQVAIGAVLPLALIFLVRSRVAVLTASALVLLGGAAQLYVIIIGGQAYPQTMFPGFTVNSSFFDGSIASYRPSVPEVMLGVAGVALGLIIVLVGVRVLRILPDRLVDEAEPVAARPPLPAPAPLPKGRPVAAS